ncbi:MAG: hypothetical protein NVS1B12_07870 [Acidimicrobiales bacterium]
MDRARSRTVVVAGLGVVTVIAVAAVVVGSGPPRRRPAAAVNAGVPPHPADPTVASPEHALDVGVADATLMATLLPLDSPAADAVAAQVASDTYRLALKGAVNSQLASLQHQVASLAGRPIYRQSVLAARLVSYTPPRAQVQAWTLLVAGQAGVADNATATFATVTVSLVFERDAWKLDATSEQPGPSPQVSDAPSSVDSLAARLAGFVDWRPAR